MPVSPFSNQTAFSFRLEVSAYMVKGSKTDVLACLLEHYALNTDIKCDTVILKSIVCISSAVQASGTYVQGVTLVPLKVNRMAANR